MKLADLLREACGKLDISLSELARRTGQSPQNLSMKLKRDSISFREFRRYMDALGVQLELKLMYPDGSAPKTPILDDRIQEKIALLEANLDLERRNAAYQRDLSIDIRTSLYSLQGFLDMALAHPDDSELVLDCLNKSKAAQLEMAQIFRQSLYPEGTTPPVEEETDHAVSPELLAGKRILLAEDNVLNAEVTRDLLADCGMEVELCSDGQEAVEKLRNAAPGYYDCVLMDVQMPVMNGLEATQQIRSLPNRIRAGIPIVAMTAGAFEEDRQDTNHAGMDAHLTKPVNREQLMSTIARLI